MPDEDRQRPRKPRRQGQKFTTSSIYLAPRSSFAFPFDSLGASLASRVPSSVQDQDQVRGQIQNQNGNQSQRNQNQEDEQRGLESIYHDRTVQGWKSRRQREKARAEYISTAEETGPRLPDDDLLTALHLHAARVFENNELLIPRKRHARAEPWPSKKRQMIESKGSIRAKEVVGEGSRQDMEMEMEKRRRVESGSGTSGRSSTSGREGFDQDQDEDEDEDKDGNQDKDEGEKEDGGNEEEDVMEDQDEDNEDEGNPIGNDNDNDKNNESDNGNNDNDDNDNDNDNDDYNDNETLHSQFTTESSSSKRTRKKYKRRDMYRAFDGSALLALGILVEEFIISQIHQAGYKRRSESDHLARDRIQRHDPVQLSDTENDSLGYNDNSDDNDNDNDHSGDDDDHNSNE